MIAFVFHTLSGDSRASAASEPVTQGAPPGMRLITPAQYTNTIAAIFGSDLADMVRANFASINRTDGLVAVGASTSVVTPSSLARLEVSARTVAVNAMDETHRDFIMSCKPINAAARDDDCARTFLAQIGRLLYRRALTPLEIDEAVKISALSIGEGRDFYFGISTALSGMLVSPQFIYIQERIERAKGESTWQLDGYSKASRLSFLLWNSAPDDVLLSAAERGDLHAVEGLREQVERMIESRRLEDGVRAFFSDMLMLEAFDTLAKDPVIYPAFTLRVANAAREQMLLTIVDHLITRDGDYRSLFTTRKTFLTRDLAMIYGVPASGIRNGWAQFEFSADSPRVGLLTQVGFLAQHSHAGRSSPTKRGKALRETLLCQYVPDPPGNADISFIADGTAKTARERLAAHRTNPVCAGCHRLTDPIGLALENFDGAGQFRNNENGAPIDASGEFDSLVFGNSVEFGQAISENKALSSCLVSRLVSYGVGRKLQENEYEWIKYLENQFAHDGFRVPQLLRSITTSDAFFKIQVPDDFAALGR